MKAVTKIDSKTVVLNISDIDTDQIIPARFLTTTTLDGLGKYLFYDWRYNSDGTANPEFILNDDKITNCHILVAGHNFGCGSSREHAPWALIDFGFQAIISSKIADIFRSNALKNGLIPIEVNDEILNKLLANPGINLSIDIKKLILPNASINNNTNASARPSFFIIGKKQREQIQFIISRSCILFLKLIMNKQHKVA